MQPVLCLAPETLHNLGSAAIEDSYQSARDILLHVFIYTLVSIPSLGTTRGRVVSSAPSTEPGIVEMCRKCLLSKLTEKRTDY